MEDFILEEMIKKDIDEVYKNLHLKYVEKYCTGDRKKWKKEYEIWYNSMLESPFFKVYIIKNKIDDSFAAIIKFELYKNIAIINIHISESMRNKGLSYLFIKKGIDEILKNNKKIKYIQAYILKENEVSMHIFEKLEFKYLKNCNYNGARHMVYRLEIKKR